MKKNDYKTIINYGSSGPVIELISPSTESCLGYPARTTGNGGRRGIRVSEKLLTSSLNKSSLYSAQVAQSND